MPRLTQSVPKYRRHSSGQAIVTLGYRDHYLGKYGSKPSRMLYDRLVAEWLARDRKPEVSSETDLITVKAVIAAYWQHCKRHYRKPDGTRNVFLDSIRHLLKPLRRLYGEVAAEDFGPKAFKAAIHNFIPGKSRCYGNKFIARVKMMFRWAASEELVPVEVFTRLSTVKGLEKGRSDARETEPIKAVANAVVDATIKHLPPMVADMVRLQRMLGARPGEIVAMQGIEIDRRSEVWYYSPKHHKTNHKGKSRVMAIGSSGRAILMKYLEAESVGYLFQPKRSVAIRLAIGHSLRKTPPNAGNAPGRKSGPKQPKRRFRECYTVGNYRQAIERAAEKAGVEKWSPNQLRHAAAEEIQSKLGIEHVQAQLGHSSKAMSQHYAKQNLKLLAQVAEVQT